LSRQRVKGGNYIAVRYQCIMIFQFTAK
jgi:hypothetical protein